MIRCIAVDDEPLALSLIKSYIEQTPKLELIGAYSSALQALEAVRREQPDLLFLDIQMPTMNGIELASLIDTYRTKVVFTTAFSQYALEGFRVDAIDYLLKPISYDNFSRCVDKVERLLDKTAGGVASNDYMVIKSDYRLVKVQYSEVLYLESLRDYVLVVLADGTQLKTLSTLKGIESTLPNELFRRVHRSFIVNLSNVRVVERNTIIFGRTTIPISESYRSEVMAVLGLK